jgi:glyoxylase-like metal-dependent hydrolase (beta-lactamase superfamily II)
VSVAPSSIGTQPIGETSRVSDGIFQIKLPVPFPLKFVASYLVEDRDGWTVIDPGFDYPPAREIWGRGAAEVGLDLERDLARIIVTHLHPDHIGLARWLEERSGAPVWMLEGEIENARRVWDPARVLHTPGHSDFHFILHDERRRLLFAGDHLLLEITPNIGLWTYTAPRPLRRYLDSIASLRDLDVDLVFPGHGPLFHDLEGRVDELLAHHEERLSVMLAALDGKPATPFEVARRVFPEDLTDHQLRFALAETLAHLEHLEWDGYVEQVSGDVVSYQAV